MRDPILIAVLRRIEYKLTEFEEQVQKLSEKLDALVADGLRVHISVGQGEGDGEESDDGIEMV